MYRSPNSTSCPTSIQPNGWGCGYTYGFRVPLLVVSAYTDPSYVSGSCAGNCPQAVFPYVHDFGSILAFTENNFFNLGYTNMGFIARPGYADFNAPDGQNGNIPLSDFFDQKYINNPRQFESINVYPLYTPTFFETYYSNTGYPPTGPDTD